MPYNSSQKLHLICQAIPRTNVDLVSVVRFEHKRISFKFETICHIIHPRNCIWIVFSTQLGMVWRSFHWWVLTVCVRVCMGMCVWVCVCVCIGMCIVLFPPLIAAYGIGSLRPGIRHLTSVHISESHGHPWYLSSLYEPGCPPPSNMYTRAPFTNNLGLTLIPGGISNHMPSKVWYEISLQTL